MQVAPSLAFDELTFCNSPFLVQVHGLQLNQLNKQNAHVIGNFLGSYMDVNFSQDDTHIA